MVLQAVVAETLWVLVDPLVVGDEAGPNHPAAELSQAWEAARQVGADCCFRWGATAGLFLAEIAVEVEILHFDCYLQLRVHLLVEKIAVDSLPRCFEN